MYTDVCLQEAHSTLQQMHELVPRTERGHFRDFCERWASGDIFLSREKNKTNVYSWRTYSIHKGKRKKRHIFVSHCSDV
jgi:primosomal protein N''